MSDGKPQADTQGPPLDSDQPAELLKVGGLITRYPTPQSLMDKARRQPRDWVNAVDGLSFTIRGGQMLALVGESGCGKTTTAHSVMRMVDSQAGQISFAGADITHLGHRALRRLRRRMQMIYQDPYESLDPRYTVWNTVLEPLRIHGEPRATHATRVRQALIDAGLSPPERFSDRYPHQLSGGQRQRVAIASALVLEPELLIADEPVSMLDVSVRAGILELLAGLKQAGLGILLITHDLSTAVHYADWICVMYLGRIVEEGPARTVVRSPKHPYTQALVSVVPSRDPRDTRKGEILAGETPNPIHLPQGCRFHPRCPIAQDSCQMTDPQLRPPDPLTPEHQAACILA